MKYIFRSILILVCIFIILSVMFRPKVLRENHGGGGGGGHGGGGHGGGGHGGGHHGGGGHGGRGYGRGGHGWGGGGGWGGGAYEVNPLYIYDDYDDAVYYSYPYYFF